jgi:hypothetical protein
MIKMDFCEGQISEQEFVYAESSLRVNFPERYKKLIQSCNAGSPEKISVIYFDNVNKQVNSFCFGAFLSFKEGQGETGFCDLKFPEIIEENLNAPEFFPANIIAFAADPFGNYFCFDYRAGKENPDPPVVFWQHEAAGRPEAITPLADNFEAFLGMLKSEEEAEKEFQEMKKRYEQD